MRILVCNDDGIAAPGLDVLAASARTLDAEVWVVAPERKWTAASHQLSFDRVLKLTRAGEREYACSGAPADCVIAAMTLLFGDGPRPDLVLAGLNDKFNVAEDVAYSGTMAVAREGSFWGVPAISLSAEGSSVPLQAQADAIGTLVRVLWNGRAAWSGSGHWLSLNLPARLPAPMVQATVGRDKIGAACELVKSTRDQMIFRIARGRPGTFTPGDERAVVAAGNISVVRHHWLGCAAIPLDTVDAWSRALR